MSSPRSASRFLDIAVAQREAEIEPDRVLDDLGWEAMTAVAERSHAEILPDTPLTPDPVSVTMPVQRIVRIIFWRAKAEAKPSSPAVPTLGRGSSWRSRR